MAGVVVGTDPVQDIIAAGVFVIAFLGYRNGRRAKAVVSKLEDTSGKLDEVHALVNDQLSKAVQRRDVSEAENVQLRADAEKDA